MFLKVGKRKKTLPVQIFANDWKFFNGVNNLG